MRCPELLTACVTQTVWERAAGAGVSVGE